MAQGKKRNNSGPANKKPKRPRFVTIDTDGNGSGSSLSTGTRTGGIPSVAPTVLPAAFPDTQRDAAPQTIQIETVNVYASMDGRRLGQKVNTTEVQVNPAEWLFARNPASEDASHSTSAATPGDDVPSSVHEQETGPTINVQDSDCPAEETTFKRKRVRHDLRAATQVTDWQLFRDDFLDELLRYEGCDRPIEGGKILCERCNEELASVRCRDCRRRPLCCVQCLIEAHADLPLHRPEKWDGERFIRTTLRELGLVVQLGHSHGACGSPSKSTRGVVIVDVTGIQTVQVRWCECLDHQNDFTREWVQLFREGWFPATTSRPETAATFQLLRNFHELNLQAKTNLHDFSKALERLTDGSGSSDVHNRYKQLAHITRLWRHLVFLKRFGRAHDPLRATGTEEGQLALDCPACPHPGKNIPEKWYDAPPHIRWLYTLFLMMDANFRARCKDRGFDDVHLAPGWAYFVEEKRYQAHLKARAGDRQEENTCSVEHNAIVKAGTRREGYVASGVGAVLCARHALVRKNGAGDLQLGEKQANMDYIFFSTLMGVLLAILISYDVVCQWYRHLWERMTNLPPNLHLDRTKIPEIRYAIPKEHIRVHGPGHSKFSFNFLPRVGRTYGEGIESQWGFLNPLALSTREMTLGARHELMDDHWGAWNWTKILSFGSALLRALEEAHVMCAEQKRVFHDYTSTFNADVVATWEAMIAAWNADPSQPDPYEESKNNTSSLLLVKHEIALEEAEEYTRGKLPPHEVTPGAFLQVGLELEEQQRTLRIRGANGKSVSALTQQQTKRNVLQRRIEAWQAVQDVHMPGISALRLDAHGVTGSIPLSDPPAASAHRSRHPEDIPLLLPSSLPDSHRSIEAFSGILAKERRLRLAQLSDALDDIRHLRRILAGISDFTRRNIDGEGTHMTSRVRSVYINFELKVKRATERYRAARVAMLALDPEGTWTSTFQPLLDGDIRGPRRDDGNPSEGRYEVSWIWLAAPATPQREREFPTSASAEEFTASMRVEWTRAKARAERWEEEVGLLQEEMRRVIAYCEWKASWWKAQGVRRSGSVSDELARGLHAYAAKQQAVWEGIARRSASWWVNYMKDRGPLPSWLAPYEQYARKVRPRDFSKRRASSTMAGEGGSNSDDSDSESDDTAGEDED